MQKEHMRISLISIAEWCLPSVQELSDISRAGLELAMLLQIFWPWEIAGAAEGLLPL